LSLTLSPTEIVERSNSPLVQADPSWRRVPLGTVVTILNGAAFKSSFFTDTGMPLIRIRDISSEDTTVRYAGPYDDRYVIRWGELLVGMDGDFNVARWRGPDALLNQRVCCLRPSDGAIDIDFLTYLLPGYLQAVHDVTSSTTVKHLSSRDVAALPIPLPEIAVQRRIAALLAEIDARRASIAARLIAARATVERLRIAVLAAACSGRLTADWRHDPDDPDSAGDLPRSWSAVSLRDIVRRIEAGKSVRAEGRSATPEEWGVIKVSAMSWGKFLENENKAITDPALVNPRYEIKPGDVLISRANTVELVGASVHVERTRPRLLLSDKSLRLVPRDGIDKAWLNLSLRSPQSRAQFARDATGTSDSMRNLSQAKILATTVTVPPLDEQLEVVRRAQVALDAADRLDAATAAAASGLDDAVRAAVAKAFRGELTSA
jgi:type I restriction enzyme S subunit